MEPDKVMMLKSPGSSKGKEFYNWLTLTGLPGGLCSAGKLHSTQVYAFT